MAYAFGITLILLVVSIYFNWKFANTLLKVEDELDDCLDTINEKYAKMSEILSRPLFFDSPEVRRVVQDIRDTRNSLHRIALALSKDFKAEEEMKQDDNAG
jgi:hypothetical protein